MAARIHRLVASLQSLLRGILPLVVALVAVVTCPAAAAAPLATVRFESLHDNSDVPPPDAASWVPQALPDNWSQTRRGIGG